MLFESTEIANLDVGVVDPRMSAEAISACFLHCILKGLHRSPRIVTDREGVWQRGILNASDVSCLVIPDKCLGLLPYRHVRSGGCLRVVFRLGWSLFCGQRIGLDSKLVFWGCVIGR